MTEMHIFVPKEKWSDDLITPDVLRVYGTDDLEGGRYLVFAGDAINASQALLDAIDESRSFPWDSETNSLPTLTAKGSFNMSDKDKVTAAVADANLLLSEYREMTAKASVLKHVSASVDERATALSDSIKRATSDLSDITKLVKRENAKK